MDTGGLRLEGRRLADRYALEEELASGGMGTVWRATDEVLGRPVAVKILHDQFARDEDVLDRFRLEAVAAARLSHPNVVRVYDTGIDDGVCFIVMELFDGRTLERILGEQGPLAPSEAAQVIHGVLLALAHAHREGVVHRDVKPSNILVDRSGFVKVADFGIAKAAFAGDLTTTGNILGTARYLAPEQVAGGPVDGRADLYAAGIVLYEALTGRVPFEADTHIATATMRLTTDPKPPGALRPGVPRSLDAVVMRALARDPAKRFLAADEMNAALERVVPTGATERIDQQGPERRPAPERVAAGSFFGRWVFVPLVILVLAGLAVGTFAVVSVLLDEGGPAGGGRQTETAEPLQISGALSYDPEGDGGEHDSDLRNVHDGVVETNWTTEGYFSEDFGGTKDGVGLIVELAQPRRVGLVRIVTDAPGWAFQIYAADAPDAFDRASPIRSTDGDDQFRVGPRAEIAIEPTEARYLLVWIVDLVEADGWRAQVNEIELYPAA